MKKIYFILAFLFLSSELSAQTTVQIGTGIDVPASTLFLPVYRFSATSTTTAVRADILFLASEMAAAGIPAGAVITSVEFNKTNTANFVTAASHSMYMGNTTNTTLPNTTTWASILSTHSIVYTDPAFNLPNVAGWVPWTITPFVYTGNSFEIATEQTMVGSGGSNGFFQWEYTGTVPVDRIVGLMSTSLPATLNGTVATYKHRPNIKITFVTPLAIKLQSFNGYKNENDVLLNWSSVSETLSGQYFIERSKNGLDFEEAGKITANGNSSDVINYSYTDRNAVSLATGNALFYRLRMEEQTGKTEYSKTIYVVLDNKEASKFSIFPNPVKGLLNIKKNSNIKGLATVEIRDITGKLVHSVKTSSTEMQINMGGLSVGKYLLKYADDDCSESMTINKQ